MKLRKKNEKRVWSGMEYILIAVRVPELTLTELRRFVLAMMYYGYDRDGKYNSDSTCLLHGTLARLAEMENVSRQGACASVRNAKRKIDDWLKTTDMRKFQLCP